MSPLEELAAAYQAFGAVVVDADESTQQLVEMFDLQKKQQLAEQRESELLMLRGSIEVLWIEIGAVADDIIRNKLYRYRRDEQGNYFRTAKAYFAYLDTLFKERGWQLSRTTLYRFADDYHLFVHELGLDPKLCQTLGKSTLTAMAPAVRKLLEEGDSEGATDLVQEVLLAVEANEGLPTSFVNDAVDEATGRVMKSVEIGFSRTAMGVRVTKLTLWWGGEPVDVTKSVLSEEQGRWLAQRLGNAFTL